MFDISPIQILIVLVIALLVFGPKRLPEMGRSIGRGIREFKGAMLDDEPPARAGPASRPARRRPPAPARRPRRPPSRPRTTTSSRASWCRATPRAPATAAPPRPPDA